MSPFHAGGGGGGSGGGGSGAATHVFDGASYTVPKPHSVALLTAGAITASDASGTIVVASITAHRWIFLIAGSLHYSLRALCGECMTGRVRPHRFAQITGPFER